MTEDINAILERLKTGAPFLADRIEETQRRVIEDVTVAALETSKREENEAAYAARYRSLEQEHRANLTKTGDGWDLDYPPHIGRINGTLGVKKGSSLSLWVDNQKCTGILKCFPMNRTYYLDFEGLEKPALDELYNRHETGEHVAFARLINSKFVDEARLHSATYGSRDTARRFQASIVKTSQFDENAMVHNGFVRLYWDEGRPLFAIIMDGDTPEVIHVAEHRGKTWNSPNYMGSI